MEIGISPALWKGAQARWTRARRVFRAPRWLCVQRNSAPTILLIPFAQAAPGTLWGHRGLDGYCQTSVLCRLVASLIQVCVSLSPMPLFLSELAIFRNPSFGMFPTSLLWRTKGIAIVKVNENHGPNMTSWPE